GNGVHDGKPVANRNVFHDQGGEFLSRHAPAGGAEFSPGGSGAAGRKRRGGARGEPGERAHGRGHPAEGSAGAARVILPLSAGLNPLGYVSPATVEVLAEIGVPSTGQTSTP